jgi:hypothetical protein
MTAGSGWRVTFVILGMVPGQGRKMGRGVAPPLAEGPGREHSEVASLYAQPS